MTRGIMLSRRGFLAAASSAAVLSPLCSVSLAATGGDRRLITIMLRGGLDGLSLVQPYGDAALAALRPGLAMRPDNGLADLDGFYGLHPAAAALLPLYRDGELAFVHAQAGPYRGRDSHIDAQDALETGSSDGRPQKAGWLNRALSLIPRSSGRRAIDVNPSMELVLSGASPADVWTTQADVGLAPDELAQMQDLYAGDPAFAGAFAEAMRTDAQRTGSSIFDPVRRAEGVADMARLAGGLLRENYRIASFSIGGWDHHRNQEAQFAQAAQDFAGAMVALREGLGEEAWRNAAILAVTEFGRAVRMNDTGGTEHGTASVAILAGGMVAGGRVFGEWPGLSDGRLLDDRDLAPTGDVRAVAASLLYQQFDISPGNLVSKVFPGLDFDTSSVFLRG